MQPYIIILLLLLTQILAFSQNDSTHTEHKPEDTTSHIIKKHTEELTHNYPTDYFRSPLNIPIVLAGTFGELRNNHFHAGIDIKTQGKEKLNIYATAEGYVSRIKVSPYGYGKALYIDHPNGYTTVYAHLNRYSDNIEEYIQKLQKENQSYEVEDYPPAYLLEVEKGEIIALSGNTGGSSAPHLHFEIRETDTEHPVNPLLFGLKVTDTKNPIIQELVFYGFDEVLHQGQTRHKKTCKLVKDGKYSIGSTELKVNTDIFGVGIKTYDRQNDANNKNGVYSIKMFVDDELHYHFDVDKLSFDEMRYINAHTDYHEWHNKKSWYNKCFIEPANLLNAYEQTGFSGHLELFDGDKKDIEVTVADVAGNSSTVKFKVTKTETGLSFITEPPFCNRFLYHSIPNQLTLDNLIIDFPAKAFYNDVFLKYETITKPEKSPYSQIFKIHTSNVPVHEAFTISIKANNFPEDLREKAIIVHEYKKRKKAITPECWLGDYLKGTAKSFGSFYIGTDTKAPAISAVYDYKNKDISKYDLLRFKITDDLSGIKSYSGKIDDEWVLMEFDAKTAQLKYYFDDDFPKGKHKIEITATDACGNTNTFETEFKR